MKNFKFSRLSVTLNSIAVIFLVVTGFLLEKGDQAKEPEQLNTAGFNFASQTEKLKTAKCGFDEYLDLMKQEDPGFNDRINAFEEYVKDFSKKHDFSGRQVITIPVVVHVVWNQPIQNISYEQIKSQIDVLNEDFRRLNADTVNTPAPFVPFAADAEIEFKLAVRDPNGNPTLGITRTQTSVTSFPTGPQIKYSSTGGKDAWPSASYLNIWTAPAINNNILGFATFPGGNPATDGVVIGYNYFGRVGVLSSPYNLGRTASHEVGHWLSLYHIWGDNYCGSDLVADTTTQETENYGCPSFPYRPNSCNQSNPNGDMFMNYMDYTNDICMNIFTQGQKVRMVATLNGIRASLQNSQGLTPVQGQPIALFESDNNVIQHSNSINFIDDSRGIPTSWNWTFPGGSPSSSTQQNPTVNYSTPGRYDVELIVSNSFGSDTIFVDDYVTVKGVQMQSIALTSPSNLTSIPVSMNDQNTLHTFDWSDAGFDPFISYAFKIRKGGTPASSNISYQSDSNGKSSKFTIRNRELDSLAALFGTVGDSVMCLWSVMAYNGLDSLSSNTFIVILKRTSVGITISSHEVPSEFSLWNNYPNPFNPVTKIRFDIPEQSFTKLTVYDINGREIALLVNSELVPGSYEFDFQAPHLSSGIYFYRLEAGNFSQTKRMILMK